MGERRVTFAGVGVQKSASGWLFRALQAHPEVATPIDPAWKEVNFFNHRWQMGWGWYESLFPSAPRQAVGEYSVLYALDSDVPTRMKRYNPEIRLLLCLRDPVERAYSQHRYLVGRGLVPPSLHAFNAAWRENPSYEQQGRYAEIVERFLNVFPRDQLLMLDYDDVRDDPNSVLSSVYGYLGVDPSYRPPSMDRQYNEARQARSALAAQTRQSLSALARRLVPANQLTRLRSSGMAAHIRDWTTKPVDAQTVPPLLPSEREALHAHFTDEIKRLAVLTGRDYSRWLSPSPSHLE